MLDSAAFFRIAVCASLTVVSGFFYSAAMAADVRRAGDEIIVTGNLKAGDLANISLSGVSQLIFENSLGGTVEAYVHYIEVIERNHLSTLVRGKCYSACALAFLAGKSRRVDFKKGAATILLHVARVEKYGTVREYDKNSEVLALIDRLTDNRLTPAVRSRIAHSWQPAAGVAFLVGPGVFGRRFKTYYCDGTQGFDTSRCEELAGADPRELGILRD